MPQGGEPHDKTASAMIRAGVRTRIAKKQKQNSKSKPKSTVPTGKARPAPRRRSPTQGGGSVFHLTPCGLDYFRALNMPFSPNLNPCIPSAMPLPSQKYRVTSRGTFRTNAAGAACIALWPFRALASDLIPAPGGNSAPFVLATDSTTTVTPANYDVLNQAIGNTGAAPWTGCTLYPGATSPFNQAFFAGGSGRSVKLVASGLRIRYTGPIVSMGGRLIAWRNPLLTGTVAATQDSIASFLALNSAATARITDQWFELTYRPVAELDLAPVSEPGVPNLYTAPGGSVINNRLALAFMVEDLPSNSFEFEAIAYFEATGPGLSTTASHADPVALATVMSATPTSVDPDPVTAQPGAIRQFYATVRDMGYQSLRGMGERMFTALNAVPPQVLENGVRVAGAALYGRRIPGQLRIRGG